MAQNTTNILELKTIKSTHEPILYPENWNDYNGWLVYIWLFDGCGAGKVENGQLVMHDNLTIDETNIIEMRIFNENEEVYFRKVNQTLIGRLRRDIEGSENLCIEAGSILFGSQIMDNGKFSLLTEDRGISVSLPIKLAKADLPVYVKIRNYVEYNVLGMAGYVDARFVKIYQ